MNALEAEGLFKKLEKQEITLACILCGGRRFRPLDGPNKIINECKQAGMFKDGLIASHKVYMLGCSCCGFLHSFVAVIVDEMKGE